MAAAAAKVLPKKVRDQLAGKKGKPPEIDPDSLGKIGKIFCLPRDESRIMELEVQEGRKEIVLRPVGPDFGQEGCKYIAAAPTAPAQEDTKMYCVPYDTGKVLLIDPVKEIFEQVGEQTKDAVSKYTECAAAHNFTGFLYAAPFKGTDYVLEINPMTGIVREVGERIPHHTSDAMWWGVKASPTCLKIFAAPYDARRVLMIDPNNGGRAVEVGPDLGDVRGKYCCLELAPNGNLYAPPFNASQVLQIDSKGNVSLTGPKLGGSKVRKYSCLLLGANKLLYAPPLEADQVLEINPNRGDSKLIGPVIGTGEAKYACACLHSNRKIYAAPLEGRRVLEIDCEDHEVREIGFDLGSEMEKYSCICEAPVTGKLYAAPRAARQFLEIDPEKGFVREVGPDLGPLARKYTVMLPGRPIQPPPVVKVERFASTAAVPKQLAAPPVAQ